MTMAESSPASASSGSTAEEMAAMIQQLRMENEALRAAQQSFLKSNSPDPADSDGDSDPGRRGKTPPSFGGNDPGERPTPVFGGIEKDGSTTHTWIGGVPNLSFTATTAHGPNSPYCYRKEGVRTDTIHFKERVSLSDSSPLFKANDQSFPLLLFQRRVLAHLRLHGMDTVFYITGKDPSSPASIPKELINHHAQYDISFVRARTKKRIANGTYDAYAIEALQDSGRWLVDRLDESLKRNVRSVIDDEPVYGPVLWMAIVEECQPSILTIVDKLQSDFKALTLAKFPGENVTDYNTAAGDLLDKLSDLDALPQNTLSTILKVYCNCSVHAFILYWSSHQHSVMTLEEKLAKQKRIEDLDDSSDEADDTYYRPFGFVEHKVETFTYAKLLESGKQYYNTLVACGDWTSVTPQANMVKRMMAMETKLNQLSSSAPAGSSGKGKGKASSKDPKDVTCYNCQEKGHYANKCPKKQQHSGQQSGTGPATTSNASWKLVPPVDDKDEKVVDGVKYLWCAKCRNGKGKWNGPPIAHKTADHRGRPSSTPAPAASSSVSAPAANMAAAPCVFNATPTIDEEGGWLHSGL